MSEESDQASSMVKVAVVVESAENFFIKRYRILVAQCKAISSWSYFWCKVE